MLLMLLSRRAGLSRLHNQQGGVQQGVLVRLDWVCIHSKDGLVAQIRRQSADRSIILDLLTAGASTMLPFFFF